MKDFGQYEDEIFADGLRGVIPKFPIGMAESERKAVAAWPDAITSQVHVGCGDGRPRDLVRSSFPQLRGNCLANDFTDPVFRSRLARPPEVASDASTCCRRWWRRPARYR